MGHRTALGVGLLVVGLAVLDTGCATRPGGADSEDGRPGREGTSRRMTRREAQQPQEPWKQHDLNGDGKITRQEFMAIRGVCFARYDASGTGMLTSGEIRKFFAPQMADRINAAFSRLDLDGDGLISGEEFARESDRLFRQMDANGDGVIAGTELNNVAPVLLADLCSGTSERRPGLPERR